MYIVNIKLNQSYAIERSCIWDTKMMETLLSQEWKLPYLPWH